MKKTTLLCLIFLFSLAMVQAAESRETLTLDASGCSVMRIDCGAGYLKVQGKEGLQRIEVTAVLRVEGIGTAELAEFRKEHVTLKLEKIGSKAVLLAKIDEKFSLGKLFGGREAGIDLEVSLPRSMNLKVEDGSGNVTINSLGGSLDLRDGSGDATVDEIAGSVQIVDGSGDLRLANIKGAVEIEDGSGGLDLSDIAGRVEIDDGSGEIVAKGIQGSLEIDDGSGSILIDGVEKDVNIKEAGSGEIEIRNVKGRVRK